MSETNLNENAYFLLEIRDRINVLLNTEFLIENRKVKELLIEKYGANVRFVHPINRTKLKIFYTRIILSETILETIRLKNI